MDKHQVFQLFNQQKIENWLSSKSLSEQFMDQLKEGLLQVYRWSFLLSFIFSKKIQELCQSLILRTRTVFINLLISKVISHIISKWFNAVFNNHAYLWLVVAITKLFQTVCSNVAKSWISMIQALIICSSLIRREWIMPGTDTLVAQYMTGILLSPALVKKSTMQPIESNFMI